MKRSKIITQQPKSLESPNIIGIKSVTVEHPKTSHKLSKTIRQGKVADAGSNFASPLYCETTKRENILVKKKNAKNPKRSHDYKGYERSCNADILNYLNPELQLKGAASAIRNKPIDLLTELRSFKFVTTLVIEFKK